MARRWTVCLPYCITNVVHWPSSEHLHLTKQTLLLASRERKDADKKLIGGLISILGAWPIELCGLVKEYCPNCPSEEEIKSACRVHIRQQLGDLGEFWPQYHPSIVTEALGDFLEQFHQLSQIRKDNDPWLLISALESMRSSRMFREDYRRRTEDPEVYYIPLRQNQVARQLWYLFTAWLSVIEL